jgi:chromosome segregation ATPase
LETGQPTIDELRREQAGIENWINDAALAGARERFVDLLLRRRSLPFEIAEARRRPLRQELARLEQELKDANQEAERVRTNLPEQVSERLRTRVTLANYRKQVLGAATSRKPEIGREIQEARKKRDAIEPEPLGRGNEEGG